MPLQAKQDNEECRENRKYKQEYQKLNPIQYELSTPNLFSNTRDVYIEISMISRVLIYKNIVFFAITFECPI